MVGVGPGGSRSTLARVCIVDWDGAVIIDTFVKATEPVTDFRTFVSGVRESDLLSEDAMDAEECRALVKSILQDKILIGHALENDLDALRISHPCERTRDTAKYAPYMVFSLSSVSPSKGRSRTCRSCPSSSESDCSSSVSCTLSSSSSSSTFEPVTPLAKMSFRPRKLKQLARERLGLNIQIEGKEHSPVEDARCALGLYKLARTDWERVMEYKMTVHPK